MSDFWFAGNEIEEKANSLIAQYHPEISTTSIAYLFKDQASSKEAESGQVCAAKLISGAWRVLTGDKIFAIIIASDLWQELSLMQQTAMLDSALTSCTVKLDEMGEEKLDKAGNPIYTIRPHDLVAHSSIVKRYGVEVLQNVADCVRAATQASETDTINDEDYDDGDFHESTDDGGAKKTRRAKK